MRLCRARMTVSVWMSARRINNTSRLERSTSVPIADILLPRIRSPSQWPGTARSAASAGRSEIDTIPAKWPWPLPRARLHPPGRRTARRVRRCAARLLLQRSFGLHEQ